jgi:hypothetical protein
VGIPTSRRNANFLLENKEIKNMRVVLDLMGNIIIKAQA